MALITATEVATGITGLRCVKWSGINALTPDTCNPVYIAGAEAMTASCHVTNAATTAAWFWEVSLDGVSYHQVATPTNAAITATSLNTVTTTTPSQTNSIGSLGLWFRWRISTAGGGGDAGSADLTLMWRMAK